MIIVDKLGQQFSVIHLVQPSKPIRSMIHRCEYSKLIAAIVAEKTSFFFCFNRGEMSVQSLCNSKRSII